MYCRIVLLGSFNGIRRICCCRLYRNARFDWLRDLFCDKNENVEMKALMLGCSVCFGGDASDPQIMGVQAGMLAMLCVILLIFILFGWFFLNVRKRAKKGE